MSETEVCSIAEAFWTEFGGLDGAQQVPSASFLQMASKLSSTGHGYLLSSKFDDYKLSANIPLSHKDVGLKVPHPVLAIGDFIKCLDANNKLDLLFMGNTTNQYKDFWKKWEKHQGLHPIYSFHSSRLGQCVPVMVHADEGTSQKKKGVMILQVQPCMGHGTSKRKAEEGVPGINFLGKSIVTRFLYSVMLTRFYSGKILKNKPLLKLIEHMALDLKSAFYDGIKIQNCGNPQVIYLVPIAMKGDWPALVKCGQLVRHHLRDVTGKGASKGSGAGICHLCLGGQENNDWFDISYNNMKKMRVNAPPPWKEESPLVKHLPLGEPYKHLFFRIDVFHTLHKGVFGDIAANSIDLCLGLITLFCSLPVFPVCFF